MSCSYFIWVYIHVSSCQRSYFWLPSSENAWLPPKNTRVVLSEIFLIMYICSPAQHAGSVAWWEDPLLVTVGYSSTRPKCRFWCQDAGKMLLSCAIWDRTRCLWLKRSRDWSLSPTLMISGVEPIQGFKDRVADGVKAQLTTSKPHSYISLTPNTGDQSSKTRHCFLNQTLAGLRSRTTDGSISHLTLRSRMEANVRIVATRTNLLTAGTRGSRSCTGEDVLWCSRWR